jgi:hypothetical protein
MSPDIPSRYTRRGFLATTFRIAGAGAASLLLCDEVGAGASTPQPEALRHVGIANPEPPPPPDVLPPPALVIERIDQTSDTLVFHHAITGALITVTLNDAALLQVKDWRVLSDWSSSENTFGRNGSPYRFGNMGDGRPLLTGNFSGSGKTEFLFCSGSDGNWWLGRSAQSKLSWSSVGNTLNTFGDLSDGRPIYVGNFSGSGRTEILFYAPALDDGNWWLGQVGASEITWSNAGNTLGHYGSTINFGNIADGRPFFRGDFSGSGKTGILFYSPSPIDGNWWLGEYSGTKLTWSNAGNTLGHFGSSVNFGNIADGRPFFRGDFSGSGKAEILFYSPSPTDGNWWLGKYSGTELSWLNVGNTLGHFGSSVNFGDIADGRPLWTGNFSGAKKTEILFYSPSPTDGNWWLGQYDGTKLSWLNVGNTLGHFGSTVNFGNVADGRPFCIGNFTGSGQSDILFYFPGDQNWWLGVLKQQKLSWSLAGNTRHLTQNWDKRPLLASDLEGAGRDNIVFYSADSGRWSIGLFDRAQISLPDLLVPGDRITATQTLNNVKSAQSAVVTVELACTMQHFDRNRTGWNPHEATLTRANCQQSTGSSGGLRQLFTQQTDGQIYAQPLYAANLSIPGKGAHNVVFVVTENNWIYAFDADSAAGPNAAPLLSRQLVSGNETAVPWREIALCPNIVPTIGISGTPVIDLANQVLYLVVKVSSHTLTPTGVVPNYMQRVHALDLTTLADRPESPIEVKAEFTSVGAVGAKTTQFNSQYENQRAALLLNRGKVYIAFAAHCDQGPYAGWILGYDAATLTQLHVFNAAPNAFGSGNGGAGIWQGGDGPACDREGNIFCATGNGDYGIVSKMDGYSFCVLKLSPGLEVLDYFMPFNVTDLNDHDWDLGSGGPLLIPTQDAGGKQLLTVCGKEGRVYVIDQLNLGKFAGASAGKDTNIVDSFSLYPGQVPIGKGQPAGNDRTQPGVWGGPAYASVGSKRLVFYCGAYGPRPAGDLRPPGGPVNAYTVTDTPHPLNPDTLADGKTLNQSIETFPGNWAAGATPVVSSSGSASESAILWIIRRSNPLQLLALNPLDLTQKLVQLSAGPWSSPKGTPMIEPTVINGKVYVGSDGQLNVYGL